MKMLLLGLVLLSGNVIAAEYGCLGFGSTDELKEQGRQVASKALAYGNKISSKEEKMILQATEAQDLESAFMNVDSGEIWIETYTHPAIAGRFVFVQWYAGDTEVGVFFQKGKIIARSGDGDVYCLTSDH